MTIEVTVYCYVDLHFVDSIEPFISQLKEREHKVVIGHEVDELLLPLSVANPTVVAYYLQDDELVRREPFRTVKEKALELSVPLLLLGPAPLAEGVVLLVPTTGRYEARRFSLTALLDFLPELSRLLDTTPEWMKAIEQSEEEPFDDTDAQFAEGDSSLIVDVIELGSEQLEIETIYVQQGSNSHISTQVRREGQLLVREEQTVVPGESEIRKMMEAQHQIALSVYTSTSLSRERIVVESEKTDPIGADELSAPIVLSEALESDSETQPVVQEEPPPKSRAILLGAVGGAVALLVIVLVWLLGPGPASESPVVSESPANEATTIPGPALPDPAPAVAVPAPAVAVPAPAVAVPAPAVAVPAPAVAVPAPAVAVPAPAVALSPPAEEIADRADANAELLAVGSDDKGEETVEVALVPVHVGKEMVFAARFRPYTATFWFLNEEAEEAFLEELEPWKEGHTILVQGFASEDEIKADKGGMATSRSWAVKRYLIRRGFDGSLLQTKGYRSFKYTDDMNRPTCKPPYCWVSLKVVE